MRLLVTAAALLIRTAAVSAGETVNDPKLGLRLALPDGFVPRPNS